MSTCHSVLVVWCCPITSNHYWNAMQEVTGGRVLIDNCALPTCLSPSESGDARGSDVSSRASISVCQLTGNVYLDLAEGFFKGPVMQRMGIR
jgi:hypothetical protein